jgi:hypothetical protein
MKSLAKAYLPVHSTDLYRTAITPGENGLRDESVLGLGIFSKLLGQEFQRDLAAELEVFGLTVCPGGSEVAATGKCSGRETRRSTRQPRTYRNTKKSKGRSQPLFTINVRGTEPSSSVLICATDWLPCASEGSSVIRTGEPQPGSP